MIPGIYALKFNKSSIYIGKSTDVYKRFKQHIQLLESNKHTSLMQQAYLNYGLPKLIIKKRCHIEDLVYYESWYINKYLPKLNSQIPKLIDKGIFKKHIPRDMLESWVYNIITETPILDREFSIVKQRILKR